MTDRQQGDPFNRDKPLTPAQRLLVRLTVTCNVDDDDLVRLPLDADEVVELKRILQAADRDCPNCATLRERYEAALKQAQRYRAALLRADDAFRSIRQWCLSQRGGMTTGHRATVLDLLGNAPQVVTAGLSLTPTPEPPTPPTNAATCPECGNALKPVVQSSNSYLNFEQWDASKCGDYVCDTCICYWVRTPRGLMRSQADSRYLDELRAKRPTCQPHPKEGD